MFLILSLLVLKYLRLCKLTVNKVFVIFLEGFLSENVQNVEFQRTSRFQEIAGV